MDEERISSLFGLDDDKKPRQPNELIEQCNLSNGKKRICLVLVVFNFS